MKFKLDENLPVSVASVLAAAGHDVDTVPGEHLAGRPDHDIVAASTAAKPGGISLDVGLGDIKLRSYGQWRHQAPPLRTVMVRGSTGMRAIVSLGPVELGVALSSGNARVAAMR